MALLTPAIHSAPELLPPLKWAGGKRRLVPAIGAFWEKYSDRRLVEPFVGGMAVALGLRPTHALLNDANPHLVNFYRQLQRGLVTGVEMRNDRDLYYRQRERFNNLIREGQAETEEAAGLFYYLNRTCFNGLCRFNSSGEFNVPFGKYGAISYTSDFRRYVPALAPWEFTAGHFTDMKVEPTDFIYADPPYDVQFTAYSAGGFSWADQQRLAEWLAAHPGPVVASNQATPRILDLYSSHGFEVRQLPVPRMIACNGNRTPALEMLATRGIT